MADVDVDLKPDRSLINPHFDGYKLSLDPLPSYPITLDTEVNVVRPSEKQYTYQHVKGFSLHNHLVGDPWNEGVILFVDSSWRVQTVYATLDVRGSKPACVLQLPDQSQRKETEGCVNASLTLPSPDWAVLSDGTGRLFVARTHARVQAKEWQVVYCDQPLGDRAFFTVVHSVMSKAEDQVMLDCLLLHVDESEGGDPTTAQYVTRIDWLTLKSVDNGESWSVHQQRTLEGYSAPDYLSLEQDVSGVLIACDKPFKFTHDSLNPVEVCVEEKQTEGGNSDKPAPAYTWRQEGDEIVVTFTLTPEVSKSDIDFKLTHDHVSLGVKNGDSLLAGELHGSVDVEGSTWTIDGQQLTLHLSKSESPAPWMGVCKGDDRGEFVVDPAQAAEIHERLAHLTSDQMNPSPDVDNPPYNAQELEACDAFPEATSTLIRIDGQTHLTTHQVNLGSHQWLFDIAYSSDKLPGICLRHDVDGLVWEPTGSREPGKSPWQHAGTFNALGYVQASKQNKKFASSAPNHSYAVIADCQRHIYIYRQPGAIDTSLRNRKSGREVEAVAKQQLVSLDNMADILGLWATNTCLFVLAGQMLHVVKVNEVKV